MVNTVWSPESGFFLIQTLLGKVRSGQRGENGFMKETWNSILNSIGKQFAGSLLRPLTLQQVKSEESAVSDLRNSFFLKIPIKAAIDLTIDKRNSQYSQSTTSCEITNISQKEQKKRKGVTSSDAEEKGIRDKLSEGKLEKVVDVQGKEEDQRVKKKRFK